MLHLFVQRSRRMNSRINHLIRGLADLVPSPDRLNRSGLAGKVALALVALLVIGLVLLGGLFALGTFFFYDSYTSSFEYDVSIGVDGATEHAEFLLPLPVYDGEPHLDDVHISGGDRFEGIDHEVVNTEHGPMLRIEIAEVNEGPHWHSLSISAHVESDEIIDTRNPRETEPVLSPVEFLERDLDETIHDRWPDRRDFDASSTAYIGHSGDEDVEIGVSVWYRGGNDWWTGGWNGNYYETSVSGGWDAHDPTGVWIELNGWHTEGGGNYPTFPPAPS